MSRTREVFPTGSTTLLRLQLSRTRDCAHRSRHVGLLLFLFFDDKGDHGDGHHHDHDDDLKVESSPPPTPSPWEGDLYGSEGEKEEDE